MKVPTDTLILLMCVTAVALTFKLVFVLTELTKGRKWHNLILDPNLKFVSWKTYLKALKGQLEELK